MHSYGGNGFRIQLSNGESGAQLFAYIDMDTLQPMVATYEGKSIKKLRNIKTNTWYTFGIELVDGNISKIYIDNELIYESITLSTNYCASNRIFNQTDNSLNNNTTTYVKYVKFYKE